VRGHKGALFSKNDYASLQQCESLEDVKLFLVRHLFTAL
jgi:vacuolar-type H+-ATPase subunit C/Vma6